MFEDQSDENSSDHRSDTYGIELTGETPRFDFTDIETPSVIIKSPAMAWLSTNEKSPNLPNKEDVARQVGIGAVVYVSIRLIICAPIHLYVKPW